MTSYVIQPSRRALTASQVSWLRGSHLPLPLGILSIRKAGRRAEWKDEYEMPEFKDRFLLLKDPLEELPEGMGVYLLSENGKQKPLYARSTEHLRHAVELHRNPRLMSVIIDKLWMPKPESFLVFYATLPEEILLKPVEKRLIEERKPIFNVPRAAA